MMKRKPPIWLNFFIASFATLFLAVMLLTVIYTHQLINKENKIVESNISNGIYYTELSVKNSLKRYREQIGNMTTAQQLYSVNSVAAEYREKVNEWLLNIYSESSEMLAVFYQDAAGMSFSVGEIFLNVDTQLKMIHECMENVEYTHSDGLWRYEEIGRGFNSIMLCKEIIYVDEGYDKHNLGTILLYVDANKLNKELLEEKKGNGVVVIDSYGKIVFSADSELIGAKYDDVFTENRDNIYRNESKYLARKKTLDDWEIISYIDKGTSKN